MSNPFEAIGKREPSLRPEEDGEQEQVDSAKVYENTGELFLQEEVNSIGDIVAEQGEVNRGEDDPAQQEHAVAAWFDRHPNVKNTLRAFIIGSVLMGAAGPLTEKFGGLGVEEAEAGNRSSQRQVGRELSRFLQDNIRSTMEYQNQKEQITARFRAQMQRAQIQYEARKQQMEHRQDPRRSNEQQVKMLEAHYAEQRAMIMARYQEELTRLESRNSMQRDRTNMRAIGTGIEIILGR